MAVLAILVFGLAAAAAGAAGLDGYVVERVAPATMLDPLVGALDWLSGKELFDLLLPLVLAAVGAALIIARHRAGRILLYVGTVQAAAYLAADLSKPHFGRLRPFEAMEAGGRDVWLVGANSFPSGHTAFYAGLVLPVVLLFPRLFVLLLIPLAVGAQRVLSHDHYVSDVAASFAIAAMAALMLRPIAGRGAAVSPAHPRVPDASGSARST